MRDVSKEEIIGYCESREENDEKIDTLKSQIKALTSDSSDLTKETAKDFETKPKNLNEVYKKYKNTRKGEEDDEDLYSLLTMLDEALEEASEN